MGLEIKEMIEKLKEIQEKRNNVAILFSSKNEIKEKCEKKELNLRVGAIDASIISQEFHSFDLIITKTVGAIFTYKDNKLIENKYYPSALPREKINIIGSTDLMELNQIKNIIRLKEEISLAVEMGDKCDLILIDGSLVPLPGDKPTSEILKKEYNELIEKYLELFSKYKDKLVGVVKDSRSKRFIEHYSEKYNFEVEINLTDSSLLDVVLEKKEKTKEISYAKDAKTNQILKDLLPYSEEVKVSYIKAGKYDRPIRIEYFNDRNEELMSLCGINDKYTYPSILIDVDLRALMDVRDVERILKEIELSPYVDNKLLRRNVRPFR
jgi:sulfur relay (sulfurtransferase) DsrF/TusC family protein